ncbi:MAG: resolvase [Synechococcus sp.]|nr:resolvase [Synechococcus sp.]
MYPRSVDPTLSAPISSVESGTDVDAVMARSESLVGIEEVQKSLNRSRASVYRYTNTDPRNLNPPFNPRKLNPEYRSDQKDPLLFHPNEVARFAKDVLRIKEVTVEVLNSPSTATQQCLAAILDELRMIRSQLDGLQIAPSDPSDLAAHRERQDRPAA